MMRVGLLYLTLCAVYVCRVDCDLFCGSQKCERDESSCLMENEDPDDLTCMTKQDCENFCDSEPDCCCYPASTKEGGKPSGEVCDQNRRKRERDDDDDDDDDDHRKKHYGKKIQCYHHYDGGDTREHRCWRKHGGDPQCFVLPKAEKINQKSRHRTDKGCAHTLGFCNDRIKELEGCCCSTNLCNKDMDTCNGGNSSGPGPLGGSPRPSTDFAAATAVIAAVLTLGFFLADVGAAESG